jgi:hypothetical protein
MRKDMLCFSTRSLSVALFFGTAFVPVFAAHEAVVAAPSVSVSPKPSFIEEESEMSRVLAEAGPGTLVVFDIDNTLLTPCGHLGSDEWYDFLCERYEARGLTKEEASLRADEAFNRWQGKVSLRSVDPASPGVVETLRKRGVPYFALTARSAGVRDATIRQLDSLGLAMIGGFAPGDAAKPGAIGAGVVFESGVFFNGENGLSKGDALVRILGRNGLKPRRIIFVDDKAKHTRSVDAALTARGIDHLCLRFARKDAEVKAFRQDMAHVAELADGEPRP